MTERQAATAIHSAVVTGDTHLSTATVIIIRHRNQETRAWPWLYLQSSLGQPWEATKCLWASVPSDGQEGLGKNSEVSSGLDIFCCRC